MCFVPLSYHILVNNQTTGKHVAILLCRLQAEIMAKQPVQHLCWPKKNQLTGKNLHNEYAQYHKHKDTNFKGSDSSLERVCRHNFFKKTQFIHFSSLYAQNVVCASGRPCFDCFRKQRTQMDANDNFHKPAQNMQNISQPLASSCESMRLKCRRC